jgi:hypothetical protein
LGQDDTLIISEGKVPGGAQTEAFQSVDCGYFENYIIDTAKLQDVQKKWTRVG